MTRNSYLRVLVSKRDGGICAVCHKFDPKWEADHIQPRWLGGKDTLENMQTLCRRHHNSKTTKDTPLRAKCDRLKERHELTKRRREVRP